MVSEYRSKVHPLETVPLAIRLTLVNPQTGEISYLDHAAELDENFFRALVGGYVRCEDDRDILEEAVDWWDRELSAIELTLSDGRDEAG